MNSLADQFSEGCGRCCWLTAFFLGLPFGLWMAIPSGPGPCYSRTGAELRTLSHGRQLLLCLEQYAEATGRASPDDSATAFTSANQVWRECIKQGIATDERIFGCPVGPYKPDNNIGSDPRFEEALMPGECHWMLLKHLPKNAHPKTPVVIENALNGSWPPRWEVEQDGIFFRAAVKNLKKGGAWRGETGWIIIGRKDGTVNQEKLRPDGTLDWHSPNNLDKDGKSWIDYLTPEQIAKLEYWDVEEKQ